MAAIRSVALCDVHRKQKGLYLVVYAGPPIMIQRVTERFWQIVTGDGGSSDHDSFRDARIAASALIKRLR